jgi:hypothetical protein
LEHQEEAIVHLIHVQKGPNSSLFEPWSFDNKATNFVSISASLVTWGENTAKKTNESKLT